MPEPMSMKEGEMLYSDVRLEAAENGLILKWREEPKNSEGHYGGMMSMKKEKIYKLNEQKEALGDLVMYSKMNEMSHMRGY